MSDFSVAVCLLVAFHTSDAFTWLHSDVEVSFVQGQTATLFWSVDVGSENSWALVEISRNSIKSDFGKKDLITVLSNGQKEAHTQARAADLDLVVNGPSNVVNVTFTLRNLTRNTDEMYYRVFVVNTAFSNDSHYTKMIVLVRPGTPTIQVQPVGLLGKHVNLTCTTTVGYPADTTFTFFRADNQVIKTISGTVNGNYAKATVTIAMMAGINSFTCTANNSAGSSLRSTAVDKTLKVKPSNVQVVPPSLVINKTDSFSLTCHASAYPTGTYSWSLKGQVLLGETSRVLTRHNVATQDAGNYTCTVTNYLGSADSKSSVRVDVPPTTTTPAPTIITPEPPLQSQTEDNIIRIATAVVVPLLLVVLIVGFVCTLRKRIQHLTDYNYHLF